MSLHRSVHYRSSRSRLDSDAVQFKPTAASDGGPPTVSKAFLTLLNLFRFSGTSPAVNTKLGNLSALPIVESSIGTALPSLPRKFVCDSRKYRAFLAMAQRSDVGRLQRINNLHIRRLGCRLHRFHYLVRAYRQDRHLLLYHACAQPRRLRQWFAYATGIREAAAPLYRTGYSDYIRFALTRSFHWALVGPLPRVLSLILGDRSDPSVHATMEYTADAGTTWVPYIISSGSSTATQQ